MMFANKFISNRFVDKMSCISALQKSWEKGVILRPDVVAVRISLVRVLRHE